jgi:hypothetical protein
VQGPVDIAADHHASASFVRRLSPGISIALTESAGTSEPVPTSPPEANWTADLPQYIAVQVKVEWEKFSERTRKYATVLL